MFMRIDELTQIQETDDTTISGERLCFVYNDVTETTLTLAFSDSECIDDFIQVLTKWRHELDEMQSALGSGNDVPAAVDTGNNPRPMLLADDQPF